MPETQTQPEFEEPDRKYTATDMENFACIELALQPEREEDIKFGRHYELVAYIRPANKSISDLLPQKSVFKELYSHHTFTNLYQFKNFSPQELKDIFMSRYNKGREKDRRCNAVFLGDDSFKIKNCDRMGVECLVIDLHEELEGSPISD